MLTEKQYNLLMYINKVNRETGQCPSFDEMKDAIGLKSKSGIHALISSLEERNFIRKLPHHLVEAFKSTLEEAAQSDVILNVCDASSDEAQVHMNVTRDLLYELGCGDTPVITVLNKCDLLPPETDIPCIGNTVKISAKYNRGIDGLLKAIEENLPVKMKRGKFLLPFAKAGLAAEIRKNGTVFSEEYENDGIKIDALADLRTYEKIKGFKIE